MEKQDGIYKCNKCGKEYIDCLLYTSELKNELNPDLIFIPSPHDIHQDHQVIANEGLRAFKRQTILAVSYTHLIIDQGWDTQQGGPIEINKVHHINNCLLYTSRCV